MILTKKQFKIIGAIVFVSIILVGGTIIGFQKEKQQDDKKIGKQTQQTLRLNNGKEIRFEHKDDTAGEDLTIESDKQVYAGLTKTTVKFYIDNTTGKKKRVNLRFPSAGKIETKWIKEYVPQKIIIPTYEQQEYDCGTITEVISTSIKSINGSSTVVKQTQQVPKTCTKKVKTGTTTKEVDQWIDIEKNRNHTPPGLDKKRNTHAGKSKVVKAKNKYTITLPTGKTYFKAKLKFPRNIREEFYIEAIEKQRLSGTISDSLAYGLLDPLVDSDWNKVKALDVANVSGTPTISKAQPVKITSGDDSTTGTGDIVLDWTNISTQADIGVYDENDNLLDYYFESFDSGASTAVIWVYRSWVRDGTTQAKIAYGNGPSDQSVMASTVADKDDLDGGYDLNESSGDALDITSNNNDGTVNSSPYGGTGIVDGAYSFDGTDDYIDFGDPFAWSGDWTITLWVKFPDPQNTTERDLILRKWDTGNGGSPNRFVIRLDDSSYKAKGYVHFHAEDSGSSKIYVHTPSVLNADTWHKLDFVWDDTNEEMTTYLDNVAGDTKAIAGFAPGGDTDSVIMGKSGDYWVDLEADVDVFKIYSIGLNFDKRSALYAATKSTPDFFSQGAGEELGAVQRRIIID